MEVTEMNPQSHAYKILDFKVFTVNNDVFVAFIEQGYTAWQMPELRCLKLLSVA